MQGTLLFPNDAQVISTKFCDNSQYLRLHPSDTGMEEVSTRLCLVSLAHEGFLCSWGFGTPSYLCLGSLHRYLKASNLFLPDKEDLKKFKWYISTWLEHPTLEIMNVFHSFTSFFSSAIVRIYFDFDLVYLMPLCMQILFYYSWAKDFSSVCCPLILLQFWDLLLIATITSI